MNDATQFFDTTGGGGGPPQPPSSYNIERSVRFNSADSAYLSRTPASAGNRKTFTISLWVKRCKLGVLQSFTSSANNTILLFDANDKLNLYLSAYVRTSTQVFRDTSAWYHIVLAVDTPNATAQNRVRIYVNNSEITAWDTNTTITQNVDTTWNAALAHQIGANATTQFTDQYLADFHNIDGQALDPTSFGEFDTNGVWQPKAYTGTYGTNGFHLPFSDNSTAAALGTDTSGNGNDWTVNNLVAGPSTTANSWSGYFDGSGDYLTSTGSGYALGAGDYTVEAWVYLNSLSLGAILCTGTSPASDTWQIHQDNGTVVFYPTGTTFITGSGINLNTWHHVAATRSGSTVRLFIDGVLKSSTTNSTNLTNTNLRVGLNRGGSSYLNGYISNARIVKGTAVYTSAFTPSTTPLTAITNTSLLTLQDSTFIDNSPNNFTITANGNTSISTISPFEEPTATDSLVDTPTNYGTDTGAGGEVRGNYATLNPLAAGGTGVSFANGALEFTNSANNTGFAYSSLEVNTGKWYCEVVITGGTGTNTGWFGVRNRVTGDYAVYYGYSGKKFTSGTQSTYGASYGLNDVIGIAYDADTGNIEFYKNGVSQGTFITGLGGQRVAFYFSDGSSTDTLSAAVNFGQRPFAYTAPSGYKALCTQNLPTPTIADGSSAMDVVLDTGANILTAAQGAIGGSADLLWIKDRANTNNHQLIDAVRGGTATLQSNTTAAETTYSAPSGSSVAWTWDAGSSTVTNTDGSITSQVRANASAGFSVVTFTMGLGSYTVGHGLNTAPSLLITKARSNTSSWWVYHNSIGFGSYLALNSTAAAASDYSWGSAPTSTVFTVNNNFFTNGYTYVVYAFSPVAGYSSFGSYTGNGSADGPFVYTGFRPRWVMVKNVSSIGNWTINDASRDPYNVSDTRLWANLSDAEGAAANYYIDFLSNGFKLRTNAADTNTSAATYVYCAFAEHPFQYSRAR